MLVCVFFFRSGWGSRSLERSFSSPMGPLSSCPVGKGEMVMFQFFAMTT